MRVDLPRLMPGLELGDWRGRTRQDRAQAAGNKVTPSGLSRYMTGAL
jgi:hypothetical protein